MFWAQALLSFAVWIGFGLWMRSRGEQLRSKVRRMGRGMRALVAGLLMVGSLLFLVVALAAIQARNGFESGSMKLWAWALVTLMGVGFVWLQVGSTAMLVTLAQEPVTPATRGTSESQRSHETPSA